MDNGGNEYCGTRLYSFIGESGVIAMPSNFSIWENEDRSLIIKAMAVAGAVVCGPRCIINAVIHGPRVSLLLPDVESSGCRGEIQLQGGLGTEVVLATLHIVNEGRHKTEYIDKE